MNASSAPWSSPPPSVAALSTRQCWLGGEGAEPFQLIGMICSKGGSLAANPCPVARNVAESETSHFHVSRWGVLASSAPRRCWRRVATVSGATRCVWCGSRCDRARACSLPLAPSSRRLAGVALCAEGVDAVTACTRNCGWNGTPASCAVVHGRCVEPGVSCGWRSRGMPVHRTAEAAFRCTSHWRTTTRRLSVRALSHGRTSPGIWP